MGRASRSGERWLASATRRCVAGSRRRDSPSSIRRPAIVKISTRGCAPTATASVRFLMLVLAGKMDDAVVHARARTADRLEVGLVPRNLPQHERIVGVEAFGHDAGRPDVVSAQAPARS